MVTIPDPRITPISKDWYGNSVSKINMLRLDEVHHVISGNKWYKLKHNIIHIQKEGYKGLLTFGGAFSNHLVAAAAVAKEYGIASIGIVRGEQDGNNWSHTLKQCAEYGMQLVFVTREEYKKKIDISWLQELQSKYANYYIIPEGGANEWGRNGSAEIASYISGEYTHICVSVGTGTTLAGIASQLPDNTNIFGYAPMKGGAYLQEEIQQLLPQHKNIQIFDEWHFGGFGKWNEELTGFMNEFYSVNHISLDMVYTAKMMYGIKQQLQARIFSANASVLCIHTGGLQGNGSIAHLLNY
jgi:1-aminocyclopropane-1-carboxylate deaminase